MPSVASSRRREWFSPVTCEICNKSVGNVQALANHLLSHRIDMRTNPNALTLASPTMGIRSSLSSAISFSTPSAHFPTNFHQSLLSPSSFSLFNSTSSSSLFTNHRTAFSSSLAIHKPNTGLTGTMSSYCNNMMFVVMGTPSTLYNIVPYNMDPNRHVDVFNDGITRPLIHLLERPIPEIIELDSDDEDYEVQINRERLDLSLKL